MLLATQILAKVEGQRLGRAVEGFVNGSYTVQVARQEADWVSGYVSNGDGKTYAATLTPTLTTCSCPDHMYRKGVTCKHQVILALHVLRHPLAPKAEQVVSC